MARNEKAVVATPEANRKADDDLDDLPPAYSVPSPSTSVMERSPMFGRTIPGLPNINFTAYAPAGSTASKGLSVINITDSAVCKSPQALAKLIAEQVALPPLAEIHIRGHHKVSWNRSEEEDFVLRFNMSRYFLPRDGETGLSYSKLVQGGSRRKTPLQESGASAIEQWAHAFCSDPATEKCFTITRKLSNWDSDYLVGRIYALLQTLNYKGAIDITFPVNYQRVIIKSNQSFGSALRSAFVGVEKYECEVTWPYASDMPTEDSDSEHRVTRKCVVRSENGWYKDWKPVLRASILNKKKGWVGLDDWMEVAMKPPESEKTPSPWGENA